jgi:hypothetical protein
VELAQEEGRETQELLHLAATVAPDAQDDTPDDTDAQLETPDDTSAQPDTDAQLETPDDTSAQPDTGAQPETPADTPDTAGNVTDLADTRPHFLPDGPVVKPTSTPVAASHISITSP